MPTDDSPIKPKRRQAAKTARRPSGDTSKLTLRIPLDTARRFGVHAQMTGTTRAGLFVELVETHCRRFVVSDRGEGEGPTKPVPVETFVPSQSD